MALHRSPFEGKFGACPREDVDRCKLAQQQLLEELQNVFGDVSNCLSPFFFLADALSTNTGM